MRGQPRTGAALPRARSGRALAASRAWRCAASGARRAAPTATATSTALAPAPAPAPATRVSPGWRAWTSSRSSPSTPPSSSSPCRASSRPSSTRRRSRPIREEGGVSSRSRGGGRTGPPPLRRVSSASRSRCGSVPRRLPRAGATTSGLEADRPRWRTSSASSPSTLGASSPPSREWRRGTCSCATRWRQRRRASLTIPRSQGTASSAASTATCSTRAPGPCSATCWPCRAARRCSRSSSWPMSGSEMVRRRTPGRD